ncbi:MAG: cytochrome c biogenesis protein CcsA, partial [Candidatus Thermoplasmatota archaeon]|nr:cytochrome c biogenesis protein CcsA [Candidatus Thermoplasmatota archaeon]
WRDACQRWGRRAWLAFLVALSLGSAWAYNVLSFGGYWAWDPVEVADLLPFLSLTVLLHAVPVHRRSRRLGLLGPSAAALAFVLVLLATFVTRSGLWSSVHAFLPTGASVTLTDPAARLVSAVAQDVSARFTTGLLVLGSATFTATTALQRARSHEPGPVQMAWQGLAGLAGVLGLAGLVATGLTVDLLHGLVLGLGLGRPLVGILVLAVLGGLPLWVALVQEDREGRLAITHREDQLVLAAYVVLLILLATLALLLLGVNGYERAVFDTRAPFLAALVLALVTATFTPGGPWAGWLLAGVGVLLGAVAFFLTGSWAWAAAPVCLVAGSSALRDLVRKAHPIPWLPGRVRAVSLVLAGLLGLLQWTSPGTLAVGTTAVVSPVWWVPVGLVASVLAIVGSFLETRGLPRWVAPVSSVLALGYGLGALLGVAALWFQVAPGNKPGRASGAGVALIHLGLALLVLGVAASTYAAQVSSLRQEAPLERGVPMTLGAYEVELVDGRVVDEDGVWPAEAVEAVVHVRKGGVFLEEEVLRLEHAFTSGFTGRGSYVPDGSPVVRSWSEDLILDADPSVPLSIRVRGTEATWVTANAPPPETLSGQVDAVSLGIQQAPGVNLVWASIALVAVGMVLRMERPARN